MSGIERSAAKWAAEIQGESVRATWAQEENSSGEPRSLRCEPPPRPCEIAPTSDVLRLRLAEELDYARRLLCAMGDELAADAPVVVRHGLALQSVDVVGQMLAHIAGVIRSSNPESAVARIGMTDLKARLARKSVD